MHVIVKIVYGLIVKKKVHSPDMNSHGIISATSRGNSPDNEYPACPLAIEDSGWGIHEDVEVVKTDDSSEYRSGLWKGYFYA